MAERKGFIVICSAPSTEGTPFKERAPYCRVEPLQQTTKGKAISEYKSELAVPKDASFIALTIDEYLTALHLVEQMESDSIPENQIEEVLRVLFGFKNNTETALAHEITKSKDAVKKHFEFVYPYKQFDF